MTERRRSSRLIEAWQLSYRVLHNDGWRSDERRSTVNVGRGGICIQSKESLPLSSLLTVELELGPVLSHAALLGRVVWRNHHHPMYEHGIEFCWLDEWNENHGQQAIQSYIDSLAHLKGTREQSW